MSPGQADLPVKQGADFEIVATYSDPGGNPINLTGYSLFGKVVRRIGSVDIIVSMTCAILNQTTNAGEFSLKIAHGDFAKFPREIDRVSRYPYDVWAIDPSGNVIPMMEGDIIYSRTAGL